MVSSLRSFWEKNPHTWCVLEASQDISVLMGGISEVLRRILHFNVAASSAVIFNLKKYSSALPFDQSALFTVTSPPLNVCLLFHLYLKTLVFPVGLCAPFFMLIKKKKQPYIAQQRHNVQYHTLKYGNIGIVLWFICLAGTFFWFIRAASPRVWPGSPWHRAHLCYQWVTCIWSFWW